jgi:hypothetical protein
VAAAESRYPAWTFNDFPSVFLPSAGRNKALAKRLAASLFDAAGYIEQLHAAPGHVLPVLRTIGESAAYRDNEIIRRYPHGGGPHGRSGRRGLQSRLRVEERTGPMTRPVR